MGERVSVVVVWLLMKARKAGNTPEERGGEECKNKSKF